MSKVGKKAEFQTVYLPYGAQKFIAEQANVSTDTVRNVLKGSSQNLSVMKALKQYLAEYKEIKDSISTTAHELSFA